MCSMRIKSQYVTEWMKITLTACQLILYFLIVISLFIWGKDGIHKCFIWEVQLLLALVLPICNIRHTIAGFLNIIQLLLKIGSWLMPASTYYRTTDCDNSPPPALEIHCNMKAWMWSRWRSVSCCTMTSSQILESRTRTTIASCSVRN